MFVVFSKRPTLIEIYRNINWQYIMEDSDDFNQQTMENTNIRLKNLAWLGRSLTKISLEMYDFPRKIMKTPFAMFTECHFMKVSWLRKDHQNGIYHIYQTPYITKNGIWKSTLQHRYLMGRNMNVHKRSWPGPVLSVAGRNCAFLSQHDII